MSEKGIWKAQDGAVNEKQYFSEKIRLLWVLKEPNVSDFDFKEFLQDSTVYNRWKNSYGLVVKVSNTILNNIKDTSYLLCPSNIPEIMSRIALVNVKKTGGEGGTDDKKIREYISENPDELKKQIEELSPDIIMLAGTAKYFLREELDDLKKITGKKSVMLKPYHPAQRRVKHAEYISYIIKSIVITPYKCSY